MTYLFNATRDEAGKAIGRSPVTLKKRRLTHCYTKIGRKCLRYCLSLLLHWQQNPHDPAAYDRLRLWLDHYPAVSQPERDVNRQQPATDKKIALAINPKATKN
jgi:hypothetical protein